jgi:hypothetical protein
MTRVLGRAWLVALVTAGLLLPGGSADAAPADTAHKPDIRTRKPTDLFIDPSGESGGKELRLSNTIWNAGDGPLELRPENDAKNDTTIAYQRIYSHHQNGSPYVFRERQVGTFIFHPTHGHWHFEGFALYQILEVTPEGGVGAELRRGEKVSFCIINTDNVPDSLEHSGWGGNYNSCGQNVLYGLRVGWGDTYTWNLAGQFIPIAGLPDGIYWLRSTADFENRLRETNNNNNSKKVKIQITGNSVSVVP